MQERILELLEEKKFSELKNILTEENSADIGEYLEAVPLGQLIIVFRLLPKELAAEVFVEMESDQQVALISAFTDKELTAVLDELFVDDFADIVEEMPAVVAKRLLKNTDADTRRTVNQILAYPEDSAGSIMTTEYVDLKRSMTVSAAFERIRKVGIDKETLYTCYVTDSKRHLHGVVSARQLMLADPEAQISDIMEDDPIFAYTTDDKESVAQMFDKYDMLALPIVDNEKRLIGIVTVDDAIDVLQEEATEDIEKMAAITPTEKPYLRMGVLELFRSRIVWLLILMISATFTGMIITSFESALASCVVLTAFMPMLMNTGGNSGSQASVTVIRALSLGEVEFRDIFRVLWKELRVSILCGAALSVLNFVKMWLFDMLLLGTAGLTLTVIAVVNLTLFFTVFIAKIVGCALPIAAKKLHLDPAVMASPFITTIVDAISLVIYFAFAVQLLGL